MARFLSPEWAEEFSAALSGLAPATPAPTPGAEAPDGPVTVVEEVHGTPDGDVRLVLRIEDGALGLQLEAGPVGPTTADPGARAPMSPSPSRTRMPPPCPVAS